MRKYLSFIWKFEVHNCSITCSKVEVQTPIKAQSSWDKFQINIYNDILKNGINKFRFNPTVIETMDPPLSFLGIPVFKLNRYDQSYLRKLSKNFVQIGGGYKGTIFGHCSDSRVQKILTLIDLKLALGKVKSITEKDRRLEFIEFGGGFGQMAELVISQLNPISYKIIDLPLIANLARFYLSHQNLGVDVEFTNEEELNLVSSNTYKIFISSWGISECNLKTRNQIEMVMSQVDLIFLEVQDYFDEIDNYGWLTEFINRYSYFDYESSRSTRAYRSRLYVIKRKE